MGQCAECHNFFGPDHIVKSENGKTQICRFCRAGKPTIEIFGKDKKIITLKKQESINKYKEFMDRMLKADDIRKKILKDQISGK